MACARTRASACLPAAIRSEIGARESVSGQAGSVFYDIDVPDFRKEKLMLGGLLMTTPSVQQTPSIQPDPVVEQAAACARDEPPRVPAVRTCSRSTRRSTTTTRHARRATSMSACGSISENGTDVFVSRDELANGTAGEKPWDIYGYAQTDSAQSARARPLCAAGGSRRARAGCRDGDARALITIRP